ncbi:hypothetical protein DVV97_11285 [Clostridium botulinum]|nr:hypothetical protein [Clostridium botulinum]
MCLKIKSYCFQYNVSIKDLIYSNLNLRISKYIFRCFFVYFILNQSTATKRYDKINNRIK